MSAVIGAVLVAVVFVAFWGAVIALAKHAADEYQDGDW